MRPHRMLVPLISALLVFRLSALQAAAGPAAPMLLPRGVAEPTATTGFVQGADGAIDAIDLRTGSLLWSAPVDARPVAVAAGSLLVAQSIKDPSRLLVLDLARRGAVLRTTDPLPFPRWVEPSVTSSERFAFRVETAGSTLYFHWEAEAAPGGAPPGKEVRRRARAISSGIAGIAAVELATGRVSIAPATRPLVLPQLSLARPDASTAGGGQLLPPGDLSAAWFVGDRAFRIHLQPVGGTQALSLAISARESAAPRLVELATGRRLAVKVTADGRFLLVRTGAEAQANPPAERWEIYAVETAHRVGLVTTAAEIVEPCVIGSVLFYLSATRESGLSPAAQSLTLRAVAFRTGNELWQRRLGGVPLAKRPPLPP